MSLEHGHIRYRADIDGLRALAVTVVILYHARAPGFSGGYVGVDVFFVISGFLITQVLDAAAGTPHTRTLARFYLRRARRLLPALVAMLAVCTAIAIALYLPADLRKFGRSLILAATFLGNFGAALQGGYFDPGARFAPLRHLWSLGVEEQFYLLYPLALFAVAGLKNAWRVAFVAAVALASLLLALWGAVHAPVLNFFMLPTRAWELLVGAALAIAPIRTTPRVNELLAACGVGGILAVVYFERAISFPGIAAVAATGCTGLLIVANASGATLVARALSLRPIVFTGLISYSLYLWHAPCIAFLDYYNIVEPSAGLMCLTLMAVYVISAISWAAIEQPFRAKKLLAAPHLAIYGALISSGLVAGVGLWLVRTDGLPQRWPLPLPQVPEESREFSALEAHCSGLPLAEIAAGRLCSFGPQTDSAPRIVVWGDSHAGVLLPAYQSLATAHGVRIYFGIRGACWPLPGAEAVSSGEFWRARCADFNAAMLKGVEQLNPKRVILNAYWLDPGAASEPELRRRAALHGTNVADALNRTLGAMRTRGRSVCAILTVPGYAYPIPYAVAMAQRRHIGIETLALSRNDAMQEYRSVEGLMRSRARENLLRIADPKNLLCPGEKCLIRAPDGALLYRDANHISLAGARFLTSAVDECLADLN